MRFPPTRRLPIGRPLHLPQWTVWRGGSRALLVFTALGIAVFGGCTTVGPDYKRPKVELPKTWRSDVADSADVANSAWWELFGDTHLNGLIEKAIDANSDLLIAADRVDEFESRLQVHQAQGFPQIGYSGGFQRTQRSQEIPEVLPPT
jgi:outer membrane protein, multidrug efflux system